MNKNKNYLVTRTAFFIAMIVVAQIATAGFGNVLLTGSIVNLFLIISTMTCGFATGFTVALISPVLAKLFGIGPLWSLISFIALGNIALVTLWYSIGNIRMRPKYMPYLAALAAASVAKFLVLYTGIVKIAVPWLLDLPGKQASVISGTFSFPQLITASVGGGLAVLILPILKKAIKNEE